MPGFQHVVQSAWTEFNPHTEPFHRLNFWLASTAQRLKEWSKTLFSETKMQLHMALEVIKRLDIAQETRTLSNDETILRQKLKKRVAGLLFWNGRGKGKVQGLPT